MSGAVAWGAALIVIALWSAALVWSLWRGRWLMPTFAALAGVLATVVAAQALGGRWPLFYGVMLGVSLFLAGVMIVMGLIAIGVAALARRER